MFAARPTARLLGAAAALTALSVGAAAAFGQPSSAQLDRQISGTERKLEQGARAKRVLTGDLARRSARVRELDRRLERITAQETKLTARLSSARQRLERTQRRLRQERMRATSAQRALTRSRDALGTRLAERYKDGRPDLASIIIDAQSMRDAVERSSYLQRLAEQDQQLIRSADGARRRAVTAQKRLASTARQRRADAASITVARAGVIRSRESVAELERAARRARDRRAALLRGVQERNAALREDLAEMQAQQASIRRKLDAQSAAAPVPASGPAQGGGSGALISPIDGVLTSSFGSRWGRLHAGIDVAVPIGTPIKAAAGGRVAIAGVVSGYGNYTCIQHSASLSSCYAHQDSIAVSVGQQVQQGQVIGRSGNTGRSTGPHLHFEVRRSGTPVDPASYL